MNMEDTPCFPCQQLGETTPGKLWCSECEAVLCQRCARTHSALPPLRDHDLCDMKDKDKASRREVRCTKHRDKLVELYCKNCNVSHCDVCLVAQHRKCEDVVIVKSFVSDMKTELSELNHRLEEKAKTFNTLVEYQEARLSQLDKDKLSIIDEIRCVSQKAVDLIKKQEKQLVDQVEEIKNNETNDLRCEAKMANIQMRIYRQDSEYIRQAVSSDSELKICDAYQLWKSGQLDLCQEGDGGMGEGRIASVTFSQQKQNITEVLDSLNLGEIVTKYLPTDVLTSPELSESVNTRVKLDKKNPDIRDITVLEVEGVHTTVVTDNNNKCVKSFYTRNNMSCHSRLQLDNRPMGITQLGDNKVMVAVTNSQQIVTVAVTPDLVYETCINTSKSYNSIGVLTPTRCAAGRENYVDILNMQGEVMMSVTTRNMEVFKYPLYMCISNTGHLLVSDWEKRTITCLTSEGEVVWTYSGTRRDKFINPGGITTTDGDLYILVVDRILRKVVQLSEVGEYVRDVLTSQDGLRDPQGVCVDKHGSLYICDSGKVLRYTFVRK